MTPSEKHTKCEGCIYTEKCSSIFLPLPTCPCKITSVLHCIGGKCWDCLPGSNCND